MCGIFIAISKKKPLNRQICLNSINDLFNRGPDILKSGYFYNDRLFIANTVLSITGNSDKSKKLVSSINNNFFISFNGEIYNFKSLNDRYIKNQKFKTDTELLVNLYENIPHDKILPSLNGMFAYAIFDPKKKQIQIATDPQGEKSIYYYNDSKFIVISSTIKSINLFLKRNETNLQIDQAVLKDYFSTRHFMPIEKTSFKKLKILANASILKVDLKNYQLSKQNYDDPVNWISEKEYNLYEKMSENAVIEKLDFELNKQAKIMIPKKKFGCIFSGGIDSSLQTAIILRHGNPNLLLNINHENKDKINRNFKDFEKYTQKKILIKSINKSNYVKFANKCANELSSPFFTHDLPSRMFLSREFKRNNCKVFFGADGCDELLGGQQIYLRSFNNLKKNINNSPYSSASKKSFFLKNYNTSSEYLRLLNNKWLRVYKKYSFIKNQSERNILASLFCDYFLQSIGVANKSTDLICCDNSIEPRNIFIQKNILKLFINLPLKYKINKYVNNNLKQKYILKKLFIKYFNSKMIFKKEGFSGFPEVLYNNNLYLKKHLKNFETKKKNLYYYGRVNYARDLKWKISNIEIFLKSNHNIQI